MRALLISAALLAAAPAAAAEPDCFEPFAPAKVDPKAIDLAQICRYREDVLAFLLLSDGFQGCLARFMDDPENKADDAQKARLNRRIEGNQREKERVGEEFNAASAAFGLKKGACDGVDTRKP